MSGPWEFLDPVFEAVSHPMREPAVSYFYDTVRHQWQAGELRGFYAAPLADVVDADPCLPLVDNGE